jgi:hypothetical protein
VWWVVVRLFRGFKGFRGVDRSVSLVYSVVFTDVPASQALLNLYSSCLGGGFPISLLQSLVESGPGPRSTPVETRLSVFRVFNGIRFYTGLVSKGYASELIVLKAHVVPACTEFIIDEGTKLLEVATSWDRPVVVICQYPTRALYRLYEPLPDVIVTRLLKLKWPASPGEHIVPGSRLVEEFFKHVPRASYPFTLSLCASLDSASDSIDTCTSEILTVALDEHIATMLYAVNVKAWHPDARVASLEPPSTMDIELKKVGKDERAEPPKGSGL